MAGLFDSLSAASNALTAHRLGLDVAGQNIANINTEGYTRRMLLQSELPPADPLSAGRGIEIDGIVALRDLLIEARIRREQQDGSFDSAVLEALTSVDAAMGLPGAALDARLTDFFDAFTRLADDPMSVVARDGVVQQGRELAGTFAEMVERFETIRLETDASVRLAIDEINRLATEISTLNVRIAQSGTGVETLKDRQTVLLGQLSELAEIAVLPRDDGGVDVTLAGGRAIVIGENAYLLEAIPGPVTSIQLGDADITTAIRGGKLGGWLQVRDTTIPAYIARLDQLAYDLAVSVNAVHTTGFDATGADAGDFFVPPPAVAGAAAALAVDPAIVADSQLVAASSTGASGDNQTARAIAAIRDEAITGGGTMNVFDAWSEPVFAVGSDVAGARENESSHALVLRQLQQLRAQASGVSYDEEAAHLMRYQRAYEASARYFTTIVDTIDALMEMVR